MEFLYSSIQIKKIDIKYTINYYIINNDEEGYGLKVEKIYSNNEDNKREVVMNNISESVEGVREIIDNFIETNNDFTQIQYIIEDYAKINK